MGLQSPKHLELVNQTIFGLEQPPKIRPYGKDNCKPTTNAREKANPNALYKLSKIDITFACIDIRRAIFRYRVS
jgi:hypothetical protein